MKSCINFVSILVWIFSTIVVIAAFSSELRVNPGEVEDSDQIPRSQLEDEDAPDKLKDHESINLESFAKDSEPVESGKESSDVFSSGWKKLVPKFSDEDSADKIPADQLEDEDAPDKLRDHESIDWKSFAKDSEPRGSIASELRSSEPEASAPKASEAEASEPEASEPKASEPEASEPEASEPEASEPEASEPEASEPEASEAEASEPEASEPEASEPEASEPEASEPEASEPKASEPEASEPKASEPEASAPNERPIPIVDHLGYLDNSNSIESENAEPETPQPEASDSGPLIPEPDPHPEIPPKFEENPFPKYHSNERIPIPPYP